MRRAAAWLGARDGVRTGVFGRGVGATEHKASGRVADIADLFRACLVVLRVPEYPGGDIAPPVPKLWRVQDRAGADHAIAGGGG